jgi:hypothetical protein
MGDRQVDARLPVLFRRTTNDERRTTNDESEMGHSQRMSTAPKTTVTLTYTDLPAVTLSYPLVYTESAEMVPLGLRYVLSQTRLVLSPEIQALWRALRRAHDDGVQLRSLRPGDQVTVRAVEGDRVFELTDRGFRLISRNG